MDRIRLYICTAIGLVLGIIVCVAMWDDMEAMSIGYIWIGIGFGVFLSKFFEIRSEEGSDAFEGFFGKIRLLFWFTIFGIAGPIGFIIRFLQTRDS